MAVARVTEIIASSREGFREAVEEGVARAAQTLRNAGHVGQNDQTVVGLENVGARGVDGTRARPFRTLGGRRDLLTPWRGRRLTLLRANLGIRHHRLLTAGR